MSQIGLEERVSGYVDSRRRVWVVYRMQLAQGNGEAPGGRVGGNPLKIAQRAHDFIALDSELIACQMADAPCGWGARKRTGCCNCSSRRAGASRPRVPGYLPTRASRRPRAGAVALPEPAPWEKPAGLSNMGREPPPYAVQQVIHSSRRCSPGCGTERGEYHNEEADVVIPY